MTNPEPTCSPATRGDPDTLAAVILALDASGRRAIRQLTAAMLGALVALALVAALLGAPVLPLAAVVGLALVGGADPAFLRRLRRSR